MAILTADPRMHRSQIVSMRAWWVLSSTLVRVTFSKSSWSVGGWVGGRACGVCVRVYVYVRVVCVCTCGVCVRVYVRVCV